MEEIYWITRLGSINTLFIIILVVGILASVVLIIIYSLVINDADYDKKDESDVKFSRNLMSKFKIAFISTIIAIIVYIFVPTQEEMYIIYGIGDTLEYITESEIVEQLPDETVKVLNLWADNILEK